MNRILLILSGRKFRFDGLFLEREGNLTDHFPTECYFTGYGNKAYPRMFRLLGKWKKRNSISSISSKTSRSSWEAKNERKYKKYPTFQYYSRKL